MVSLAISLQFVNYYNRAREGGGTGGGGASAPSHFFGNYKELLKKRVFSPPTLSH